MPHFLRLPLGTPVGARAAALAMGVAMTACATVAPKLTPDRWGAFVAPTTTCEDVVEELHGVAVADPYRWLEDLEAPATRAWIEAQNRVTDSVLSAIGERRAIASRLEALWRYDAYGIPVVRGGKAFFTKKSGLQNQPVLYRASEDLRDPVPLVDPNALSEEGTIALTVWSASPDGRYVAYALSEAGSDWRTVYVVDVEGGQPLAEKLDWVKFSGMTWTPDGRHFYYARYAAPRQGEVYSDVNRQQRLFVHEVGTPQSDDRLVWEQPDDPEKSVHPVVSDDDQFVILYHSRGTDPESEIAVASIDADGTPTGPFEPLPGGFEASYVPLGGAGRAVWLLTDFEAPRQRVVRVNLDDPARAKWTTVVAENEHRIEQASLVGGQVAVFRLRDAASALELYALDGAGGMIDVSLPGLGSAYGLAALSTDRYDYFGFQSFTHPPSVYRIDTHTGAFELVFAPDLDVNPDDYVVEQVFYPSKDGTKVPMFLARHRDTKLDGAAPTLLYGYGGFDISLSPSFKPPRLVWMQMGGVFAMPNLRGGGEYGRAWHEAGMKEKKQNVFDDFISAAEWLQAQGVTRPDRTAISGRSNGGLLVGATLVQRPDLFGAAMPGVGVLDMLRFHKFTIGWAWAGEYGSADDPDEFETLYAYSPVHNCRAGVRYPATLITTGDHDDRVVPSHSYKFAAALQAAQGGSEPILIRVDTAAGHGAGKPIGKIIEEEADEWAFLVRALGISLPEGW